MLLSETRNDSYEFDSDDDCIIITIVLKQCLSLCHRYFVCYLPSASDELVCIKYATITVSARAMRIFEGTMCLTSFICPEPSVTLRTACLPIGLNEAMLLLLNANSL